MADDKTFTQADIDAAIDKANEKHEAEVGGLKTKVNELIAETKKLKRGADIKPEDLQAAEDRAEKAEQALADANKQVKTLTGERDKAVKALETEAGFTRSLLVENGLKDTLIKGGVKDEDFLDALVTKFSKGATVVAEGEARKAMLGDKELSAVVGEFLGSDAGKKFVAAPGNGGGGAPGGSGGSGGGKTMTRADFDAADQSTRAAHIKDGGKVVDQAA